MNGDYEAEQLQIYAQPIDFANFYRSPRHLIFPRLRPSRTSALATGSALVRNLRSARLHSKTKMPARLCLVGFVTRAGSQLIL
jgi:hypothetical protein